MKRFKFIPLILGMLFPAVLVAAPKSPTSHAFQKLHRTLINGIALNATASTRTFEVTEQEVQGYGLLDVYINHTNSAATDVQMDCNASNDAGATDFAIQSCSITAGVCTSTDANWTKAVAASDTWVWRIDILGFPRVNCVFSGTSAGGSDTVTVTAIAIAQ